MTVLRVRNLAVVLLLLAACDARNPVQPTINNRTVTVTKSGTGTGTVTSAPGGIVCGPACTAVLSGTLGLTMTATPAPGATFAGWSGACSGTSVTCVLPASAATTLIGSAFTL